MPIVAIAGDACTTTTIALAAAWPSADPVFVVEADPSGGDMAAWFDLSLEPSLSTLVTRSVGASFGDVDHHTRLAPCGVRLIPAPQRAGEAQQAVVESARAVVPALASERSSTVLVDTGRLLHSPTAHPFLDAAAVIVLVHRQSTQSAAAAAVRLQRLVDQIEACQASSSAVIVVAVVGAVPFGVDQIESYLSDAIGAQPVIGLPVDELAAAVFAGRVGVSGRRLSRLPLSRAAGTLAATVADALDRHVPSPVGSRR